MGRKKKNSSQNRIVRFVIIALLMVSGIYYLGLNYVPQKWYDEQSVGCNFLHQNIMPK